MPERLWEHQPSWAENFRHEVERSRDCWTATMAWNQAVPGAEGPLGRAGRSPGNGPGKGMAGTGAGPGVPAALLASSRWARSRPTIASELSTPMTRPAPASANARVARPWPQARSSTVAPRRAGSRPSRQATAVSCGPLPALTSSSYHVAMSDQVGPVPAASMAPSLSRPANDYPFTDARALNFEQGPATAPSEPRRLRARKSLAHPACGSRACCEGLPAPAVKTPSTRPGSAGSSIVS